MGLVSGDWVSEIGISRFARSTFLRGNGFPDVLVRPRDGQDAERRRGVPTLSVGTREDEIAPISSYSISNLKPKMD